MPAIVSVLFSILVVGALLAIVNLVLTNHIDPRWRAAFNILAAVFFVGWLLYMFGLLPATWSSPGRFR